MNVAADFLIAILADFKTLGPANQVIFVAFALGVLLGPFAWLWRRMKAQQKALIGMELSLNRKIEETQTRIAELTDENESLRQFDPATVVKCFAEERRDNNRKRLIAAADSYVEHNRTCFADACRILTNHHISRFEDGADALAAARACAMGLIAAAPDDRDHHLLLDEIEAMQRVEAAPPETQEEVRRKAERDRLRALLRDTPQDVAALRSVGQQEIDAGRYRTAIAIWERAEEAALVQSPTGPNAPSCLAIRIDLGGAMLLAGRFSAAREIIAPLPDKCGEVFGPEEPATLRARHLFGSLRFWEGAYADAETLFHDLLTQWEPTLGPEHLDALTMRHELASAILQQGRAAEAEELLREQLALIEKVSGPEHPDTFTTRETLANSILDQGRAAEVEELLREQLPLTEKVRGPEHPHTLTTRHTLACAVQGQGRAVEAEKLFRELLPLTEKVRGPEHPHTLATRRNLAVAVLVQGRAAEAEELLRELLPMSEKVRGTEHPDTLTTLQTLATAALEQGAVERARDSLAALPPDGGDLEPRVLGQIALLRAWIADLEGRRAHADALIEEAEGHLAHLTPEHSARRKLARYRETRGPDGKGGTTIWMVDRPPDA